MNIGIDVDDTLSSSFETIFADSQKFDIEVIGNDGNIKNLGKIEDHHYIETMYQWTKEQDEQFWTKYFDKVVKEAEAKPYAAEIVQKLKEEGNSIYIITSRYEDEVYPYVGSRHKRMVRKKSYSI